MVFLAACRGDGVDVTSAHASSTVKPSLTQRLLLLQLLIAGLGLFLYTEFLFT